MTLPPPPPFHPLPPGANLCNHLHQETFPGCPSWSGKGAPEPPSKHFLQGFELSSPVCVLDDMGPLHVGSLVPGTERAGVRLNDCGRIWKSAPGAQRGTLRPGTFNFPDEAQMLGCTLWASAPATPSSLSRAGWEAAHPQLYSSRQSREAHLPAPRVGGKGSVKQVQYGIGILKDELKPAL